MEENPYLCPACGGPLTKKQGLNGLFWECEACSDLMMGLSVLRKTTEPSFVNQLWQEARSARPGQGSPCPICRKPMALISRQESSIHFQICPFCEMFWLGSAEKAALPTPSVTAGGLSNLPPEAAEMVARIDAQIANERGGAAPSQWDWVFWLFGLPTKPAGEEWVRFPWMTVLVILAAVIIGGFSPGSIDSLGTLGALNTAMLSNTRNWSGSISYFFQLPLSNLLINLYFLVFFGASVENRVGPYPFLSIFVLPTLLSLVLSLLPGFHTASPIAVSGGVAAIMVFYAFGFPKRKIFWRFGSCPALYVIVFWLFFEIVFAAIPIGWNRMGYNTHLIGAVCGWTCWFFIGKKFGLDWDQENHLLDE